jgi:ArsR family transcriptional regulator, arsenate/arsenite/antimonite-responsive transcriptional repressor
MHMRDPAMLFRALADETRLRMLALIRRHGELCVCDVMTVLGITQSKASRHLRYLLNAGLLQDRRDTIWMYYRIAEDLDAARLAVIDSVPTLIDPEQLDQMEQKLIKWSSLKCCTDKAAAAGVKAGELESQT